MMFPSSALLIVIPVTTLAMFVLNFDEILKGKKYIGEHNKSTIISSNILCGYECYKNPSCLSFAYNNVSQQCCLYERILTDQDNSTDSDGWRTFTLKTGGYNVALGKPTMQISDYITNRTSRPFFSNEAVDGNVSTFSLTNPHQHVWWCVDLQKSYDVSLICIYSASSNYYFYVRVSNEGCSRDQAFNATPCYHSDNDSGFKFVITSCNQPLSSLKDVRCVYIEGYNTHDIRLALEEVEIYSRNVCCQDEN